MVTHVVMWKVKGQSAQEKKVNSVELVSALKSLTGKIPGLIDLEAGINGPASAAAWDVVLRTRHDSWEALDGYRVHPVHVEVAGVVGGLTIDRAVVDWED